MARFHAAALFLCAALAAGGCTRQTEAPQAPQHADAAQDQDAAGTGASRDVLTKETLAKALKFLAGRQNPNGSWGQVPGSEEPGHVGITGLVIHAFASAPEEQRSYYRAVIRAGTAYLAMRQREDGSIWITEHGQATYNTAIAAMALQAADAAEHAARLAAARDYLVRGQFDAEESMDTSDRNYGGWGYGERGDEPDADLSNAQFAMEALRKLGLPEDSPVWERARVFVSRCQNRSESNDSTRFAVLDDGGFIYDPGHDTNKSEAYTVDGKPAFPSYASMTYAGFKSLLHAYVDKDDPRVQAALGWAREHWTLEENYGLGTREHPEQAQQGLYYYYLVFAKALDVLGERRITDAQGVEHDWPLELAEALGRRQREDGSWVNEQRRWWESDPVLVTAYAATALDLCLENMDRP